MMAGYCATCNNTGYLDCHCGGDLCVCGEEEVECPECGSGFAEDDDDFLITGARNAFMRDHHLLRILPRDLRLRIDGVLSGEGAMVLDGCLRR
jgi:hypothetical protein